MQKQAPQAIGYVRVSTAEQATDGVSLDAQRARIEAWCAANGYTLAAMHADAGLSGSRADNRPGLQSALAAATKQRAALVVYSLSRLARSTRDALAISDRLDRAGADLVSLSEKIDTTSAAGKMIFRMLAVLSEFERDVIAERTSTAMRHKQALGEYIGGAAPYGYTVVDGRLVADADEQRALALVAAQRAAGRSLRRIAADLDAAGLRPRTGKAWHPQTVANIAATASAAPSAAAA